MNPRNLFNCKEELKGIMLDDLLNKSQKMQFIESTMNGFILNLTPKILEHIQTNLKKGKIKNG